jgi:hypothetical protein
MGLPKIQEICEYVQKIACLVALAEYWIGRTCGVNRFRQTMENAIRSNHQPRQSDQRHVKLRWSPNVTVRT